MSQTIRKTALEFTNSGPKSPVPGNFYLGMTENFPTTAQAVGRSEIDWGCAFEEHRRWLETVVRHRLGEPAAIEDVLQEVGLAAVRAPNRPTDTEKVAPWLYRVAVRQCLFYRRTAGRRRRFENQLSAEWPGQQEVVVTPVDWVLADERLAMIRESLHRLPELDREILLLKYTENWTYQDLARHLGVTTNAVEHRLIKARQRLRQLLVTSGVTA